MKFSFWFATFKNFGKRFSFQYFLYDSACPLRTNESKYLRENETPTSICSWFSNTCPTESYKAILPCPFWWMRPLQVKVLLQIVKYRIVAGCSFQNVWKFSVGLIFGKLKKVKSLSRVRLFCDPMDCSLPGSSLHGILQARALECVESTS